MSRRQLHKQRNTLHTLILLAAMFSLILLLGYSLIGLAATLLIVAVSAVMLVFLPRASGWLTLRLYRAEFIDYSQSPQLYEIVGSLSRRAGLSQTPALFQVPSEESNAFALEERGRALIALTDGLLRNLNRRELAGVLAHEISHIRNGDLHVMMLADFFSRITSALSHAGMLLALLLLPLWMLTEFGLPWPTLLLLLAAPMISTFLQLALSRTREFDADVDAVGLTCDPLGLANALHNIEQASMPWWRRILLPGPGRSSPSLLRTHPETAERIERLRQVAHDFGQAPPDQAAPLIVPPGLHVVVSPPRWHPFGVWF